MIKKILLGLSIIAFGMQTSMAAIGEGGIIPASTQAGGNTKINCTIESDTDGTTKINPAIGKDLGAKIHCGAVGLSDIPEIIIHLIQWILSLAGGLAVIMIMVGGFQYMLGGITDDKERGKKTLLYAIGGLVVAFFSWWIVELIQVWITS